MTQLKLIAFDADDLNVVSAHVQDAILRVGDMAWLPREKRFAAVVCRFDWAGMVAGTSDVGPGAGVEPSRLRAAVRFERVLSARTTGIDFGRSDAPLVLLAVSFQPAGVEDPAGTVTLTFAGKTAVQLDVECLEAELKDLGPAWPARAVPVHPRSDETPSSIG